MDDGVLEVPKRGRRLDAQLLTDRPAVVLIGTRRVGLTTTSVQSDHQLCSWTLAERISRDHGLEVADDVGMAPELQACADTLVDRVSAQLFETHRLATKEVVVGELGIGAPTPQPEGLAEQSRARRPLTLEAASSPLSQQPLEALGIDLLRVDAHHVSRRPRDQQGPGGAGCSYPAPQRP